LVINVNLPTFPPVYRNSQKKKQQPLIKSVRRKEIHLFCSIPTL